MRSFFAAILISSLICPTLAQKHKQQWRSNVFPDDGFGITLPPPVTPHNDGGDRHIHLYTVHLPDQTISSLRVVHRLMDCDTTLTDLRETSDRKKHQKDVV